MTNPMKRCTPRQKTFEGFTLLETLVVIAIIGIIIPALFSSIISLYNTNTGALSRAYATTEGARGLKEIIRDVRSAVYSEDGALPIAAIATSSLTIYADTDFDGRVERVRYFLTGTNLNKGVTEPTATSSYPNGQEATTTLAHGIVNNETTTPLFRYYTATSSELLLSTDTLNVRRVYVYIMARTNSSAHSTPVAFESSASIRNLKNAY